MNTEKLSLHEELALLAVEERKKRANPRFGASFFTASGGAMLAELALRGKTTLDDDGRVELLDDRETGDPLLDAAMAKLARANRPRRARFWVRSIAATLTEAAVMERLVARGIYQKVGKKYFRDGDLRGVALRGLLPSVALRDRLRSVLNTLGDPSPRDLVLLSIMREAGLLDLVFTREERNVASYLVKLLAHDEEYGKIVAESAADATEDWMAAATILDY